MQWRLMRDIIIKNSFISFALEKSYPHKPPLQASSISIPKIRKCSIGRRVYILVATQFRSCDDAFGRLQYCSVHRYNHTLSCVVICENL